MSNHLHNELRKEFQLERLILFSDAVFAIAITLIIIEIKIPNVPEDKLNETTLLQALAQLIPKFISFLVSFLLIGQYWIVHHRMFGFVTNFNGRLIWLNLFFMWRLISNPKNKMCENLSPLMAKYFSLRALTVLVLFIIFSFVYRYNPMIAFPIPMLIPVIMLLVFKPLKKKIIAQKYKPEI